MSVNPPIRAASDWSAPRVGLSDPAGALRERRPRNVWIVDPINRNAEIIDGKEAGSPRASLCRGERGRNRTFDLIRAPFECLGVRLCMETVALWRFRRRQAQCSTSARERTATGAPNAPAR